MQDKAFAIGLFSAVLAVTALPFAPMAALAQNRPAAASPPAMIASDDHLRYTVITGDTLYSLARRYLNTLPDWREVQRINRVADPQKLQPGSTLIVPTRLLRSVPITARIVAFKGNGQIESAASRAPMAVGSAVTPGMVLETGNGSFATLQLSNGSRLTVPSNTRVRIRTMRKYLLNNMADIDFALEKGRLETSATPLDKDGGNYRIRTPIAVSAVRGTVFRIAYEDGAAASLTEVIEGSVAVNALQAGTATPAGGGRTIDKGFGAATSPAGEIVEQALLPPPELLNPGRVQIDPLVTLNLSPVDKAGGYHVQIARDAGFIEIEQDSYAREPVIRFSNIPNGRWFLRVSALSDNGMEGMPQNYTMRRKLTGLSASSDQDDNGAYRFRWAGEGEGTRLYHFRLRPDAANAAPMVDETGLTGDIITLSDIPPGKYLWTVGVQQYDEDGMTTNWLPEQSLIVASEGSKAR